MNTEKHPIFNRYPDLKEFIRVLQYEVQQAQRPPSQVILDDEQLMSLLKISRRKLQYLKSKREIPFHVPDSGKRTYYLLSDILDWIKKGRVESLPDKIRIK